MKGIAGGGGGGGSESFPLGNMRFVLLNNIVIIVKLVCVHDYVFCSNHYFNIIFSFKSFLCFSCIFTSCRLFQIDSVDLSAE